MFFKVATLTLFLLVQITYQGKLMRRRNVLHISNQPNDSIEHGKSRKVRQFGYFNKLFSNSLRMENHRNSYHNTHFSDVMKLIMSTPDYGLKYTDEQPRGPDFLNFPGFHNLIEVRGPIQYRYVPSMIKGPMERIQQLKLKRPQHSSPEFFKYQPKNAYHLDEISYSREGESPIWDDSHESYKRSSGSHLLKDMKHSTPLLKFQQHRHYITKAVAPRAEVTPTPRSANVVSFTPAYANDFFQNSIDKLPFKEVKTRNQDPDSDEDEDDERSNNSELY